MIPSNALQKFLRRRKVAVFTVYNHNGVNYPAYGAPSYEVLLKNIGEFREIFNCFCKDFGLNVKNFSIDERLLIKILIKTDQRKLHYKMYHDMIMNELKVTSSLAYWFIKYKPIVFCDDDENLYTVGTYNERFVMYLISSVVAYYRDRRKYKPVKPSERLLQYIFYSLKDRPLCYDSLSVLMESLGGIDAAV